MANVSYTTQHAITAQTRVVAYNTLADMLVHLPCMGVDLVSVVVNVDHTVTITLTGPIRADHLDAQGKGFLWDLGNGS